MVDAIAIPQLSADLFGHYSKNTIRAAMKHLGSIGFLKRREAPDATSGADFQLQVDAVNAALRRVLRPPLTSEGATGQNPSKTGGPPKKLEAPPSKIGGV